MPAEMASGTSPPHKSACPGSASPPLPPGVLSDPKNSARPMGGQRVSSPRCCDSHDEDKTEPGFLCVDDSHFSVCGRHVPVHRAFSAELLSSSVSTCSSQMKAISPPSRVLGMSFPGHLLSFRSRVFLCSAPWWVFELSIEG